LKIIEPESGSIARRIILANVVLPEPDSPTKTETRPSGMCKLTPSSAFL